MRTAARRLLATVTAALLMGLSAEAWSGPPVDAACAVPDSVLTVDTALPRVAERLNAGLPLSILVVNSVKPAPRPATVGYPVRLAKELKARLPGRQVDVLVLSLPGEMAPGMVAPLLDAVSQQQTALVVWQTGTVDAMRSLDPESFGTALENGIAAVQRMGADLVVMDMQYSPHTAQVIDFAPYVNYVAWMSRNDGVFHFPRYAIMRHWVEEGRVDFADESPQAKQDAYEFVHRCIGQLLAESIAAMIDTMHGAPP
ncbi:hypothetical protein [Azospirillum doebereinerae]|uniref:SGNH/GDSL hydrolase family protein n=1 Tax=Azospirillum doebereinerae TaxID=92933 RepID=A0A3S0XCC6_9PROT|nr:hypothetical protein [Azospirillum doebereinerae]MCG5243365.1 hypothetical protein [Azospirillum doebereinerae]RUQ73625.1 hypothetical protein EJ913_08110 [Azospirillum doebereinerae]